MKKTIALFIAFFLMMSPLSADIFPHTGNSVRAEAAFKSSDTIASKLRRSYRSFDSKVEFTFRAGKNTDIQAFADKKYEEITDALYEVLSEKEFFYVTDHCYLTGTSYRDVNGFDIRISYSPQYITDKKWLPKLKKRLDKEVKTALSGMDKSWSDLQKAAYIHDRIIMDVKYEKNGSSRYGSTPYAALADKKAFCTGYARAFSLLASEAGLKTRLVYNDDHIWDLVKLGDHLYHVDCTYDDPLFCNAPDKDAVCHSYFLKSDKGLKDHASYRPAGLAKSGKYDNMGWDSYEPFVIKDDIIFFTNSDSLNVCFIPENRMTALKYDSLAGCGFYGDLIFFAENGTLKYFSPKTNSTKDILSLKDDWIVVKTTRLSYGTRTETFGFREYLAQIAVHGDSVYYNLAHSIKSYDIRTGKVNTVYSNAKSDDVIVGIEIKGNKLYGRFNDGRRSYADSRTYFIKDI